jgi:multisubunit Na+/H+ antiporter MnhB subunit
MSVSNEKKWCISLISAILFIIIASPEVFKFTNCILEKSFSISTIDKDEKPTWTGVIIHGIVFLLITRLMMNFKLEDSVLEMYDNSAKKIIDGFMRR